MRNENILENKETLAYRQSTTAIVQSTDGEILLVQKKNYEDNQWDTPGGGIEEGEEPEDAVLRELLEETGSDTFQIVKRSDHTDRYEWPDQVILRKFEEKGRTWRGQERTQFQVRFTGKKEALKAQEGELKRIKFVPIKNLQEYLIFPNQWENVYKLLQEFGLSSETP